MTEALLKKLVDEAVVLHREIAAQTERLKALKAKLVAEAGRHENDFTATDSGGSRWSTTGTDGCVARISFPAPALVSTIGAEGEPTAKIRALVGDKFDRLFTPVNCFKPAADFRVAATTQLPRAAASRLLKLCLTDSSPRVSFEAAPSKAD